MFGLARWFAKRLSRALPVTRTEVALVGPLLKRLRSANRETRRRIQRLGVNLVPVNFYSNTPSIEDIENSFEYTSPEPAYLNPQIFDQGRFRRVLDLLGRFSHEFDPALDGNERTCRDFFWKNSQFTHSDAMAYYCFVRAQRPATVVEVGSGFSTLVALQAVQRNGTGTIHCFEPFPRPFLTQESRITLHRSKAQQIQPELVNDLLRDNDILFIDSTHTVKTGSDCLHMYLRILPQIRRKILVHVHDVFLPFGMPKKWLLVDELFWTEQYLLLALLIDNPKAMAVYGSNYNSEWNRPLMEAQMAGRYPSGGSSFWFYYDGTRNTPSISTDGDGWLPQGGCKC